MNALAPVARTGAALAEGARDAARAWTPAGWGALALLGLAALVPAATPGFVELASLAGVLYGALAAVGLAFAVGLGGLPSLGQAAFVGTGAFAAALLRVHTSVPFEAAVLAGTAVALAGGVAVGAAVIRLRPALVAVATWIVTWLLALFLLAFPRVSGGSQGLVLDRGDLFGLELTAAVHYELALGLLALAMLAFLAVRRGTPGRALLALRQQPAAAVSLGVPAPRLRLGAFAAAAAVGGLAGALGADLAGVADPTDYGPTASFLLLVAVVVGGATRASGAVVGALVVALISYGAGRLGEAAGLATGRLDELVAAVIVLYVLALGGEGLVPWLEDLAARVRRPAPHPAPPAGPARPAPAFARAGPPLLTAHDLTKSFGSVVAVDRLTLDLRPGAVVALIGPNGSGKTTALRLLAGTLRPDRGIVRLEERRLDQLSVDERARLGIVRTLQATAIFAELSVLENVLVGAAVRSRFGGAIRTLAATPASRRETRELHARAVEALASFGLGAAAELRAAELPGHAQRLLMLAAAYAAEPRVLLLDEPAAGAAVPEVDRLAAHLDRLRAEGIAVLLVEHNLRLVRAVADWVVVLEAGRTIAEGTADEIAADTGVRTAYLGRQRL